MTNEEISKIGAMVQPPDAALKAAQDTVQLGEIGASLARPVHPVPIGDATFSAEVDRTDDLIAASLAGGMIAAGGKAVSAEQAVGIWREVREAMVI